MVLQWLLFSVKYTKLLLFQDGVISDRLGAVFLGMVGGDMLQGCLLLVGRLGSAQYFKVQQYR